MLFLGPIYDILAQHYAMQINHFALVKLALTAFDKTIFYFLIFAILRLIWLLCVRHRRSVSSEALVWVLAFYAILILMFTTFRNSYFPWQINLHFDRPLSEINLVFMKETWKLIYAPSRVDFIYNLFGNVLCFIPLGILVPLVFSKKQTFWWTTLIGMIFSIIIECLQFFLETGVSDIDDVFFNTCGMMLGYLLYWLGKKIWQKFRSF
ncbi:MULTISPECIES: VanZ family protein [Lactobacillus]|uniref:VanZ family protein n=1 Tax=Lactobacillus xujianguonis TaxID=2495899 RepID=A0A437SWL7_9LACO|nr:MULTISPECIES: VanZ family protein [Lactobacillus]RVU71250.1 VanZ family protein [Lactobacillus xujianguonis]RVU74095.1 VanZ family protein [Lactobacillus xujianguonis]